MVGQVLPPGGASALPGSDPNELLRRIDQQTTMMFHWLRIGLVVIILLLVAIALGF